MDVVITTLAIFVFHTTGVRFQTVACMLTRTTIYPTTTSIPPVRSPFVMLQQSHNMLIPTQTAAASGNVDQPQLLRLASWSAPLAAGCIQACTGRDGQLYHSEIFDEWYVVQRHGEHLRVPSLQVQLLA